MASHVYFLVDTSAPGSTEDISNALARILIYLSTKHEKVTWNYELIDTTTRQRPITAQRKRQISERRKVGLAAVGGLAAALGEARKRHEEMQKQTQTQRPVLATLHERLMCLEADVEWGDPALVRSPTRNASARTWTDPTRLNESMSVRNYLYIIGQPPGSLETLHDFVGGSGSEEGSLSEELTLLRDGLIGKGIWESYARKRVGVSLIAPLRRRRVIDMDPVDILIESVVDCCFESLGGCAMSLCDLDAAKLPFSTLFAPLHRTRTYPSWSRKFAREISAVVDRFALAAPADTGTARASSGHSPGAAGELFAWTLHIPEGGHSLVVKREQPPTSPRRWPTDGRLLRRYDLAEMVALAGNYKQAAIQATQQPDSHRSTPLAFLRFVPLRLWPRIATELKGPPVFCELGYHSEQSGRVFRESAIVAKSQTAVYSRSMSSDVQLIHPGKASTDTPYVAIVPFGNHAAAVYLMDHRTYLRVSDVVLATPQDGVHGRSPSDAASYQFDRFEPAWVEEWSWRNDGGLNVKPQDRCIVDVSFDESSFDCSLFDLPTSDFCLSSPAMPAGPAVGELQDAEPLDTDNTADDPDNTVTTMESWYTDLYLKSASDPDPPFSRALGALASLYEYQAAESIQNSLIDCLVNSVLLKSSAIEDAFEEGTQDQASLSDYYQSLRLHAVKAVKDEDSCRRMWQLHECQLQILLHLFTLDRLRVQNNSAASEDTADGHNVEELTASLHDLVDLLCIWASLDEIGGSAATSSGKPAAGGKIKHTDVLEAGPDDLAAAFISSPHVAQFDIALPDVLEELRVQCGWVPGVKHESEPATPGTQTASADGKRRKGTPRRIHAKHALPKSEVIVLQRQNKANLFSGRKLARHLDELIGSSSRGGPSRHDYAASSEQESSPTTRATKRHRPTSHLTLPPHLVRQIKSEVVSTMRPASASKPRSGSNSLSRKRTTRASARSQRKSSDDNASAHEAGSKRALKFT
ncbi:hypothetical protein GQ54DRAFT_309124 [Martensiomyces pterosporus]|nr:hypothetical protein GQ54DRAFT_309124 [Martensiomyces pterosporus]